MVVSSLTYLGQAAMIVLVLNAGSSSLKFGVLESDSERVLAEGSADWAASPATLTVRRLGAAESTAPLAANHPAEILNPLLDLLTSGDTAVIRRSAIAAVGHRVVHGGARYTSSVRIDPDVKHAIGDLAELAPLHNPANLAVIEAVENILPGVPQVASFDTAFHAALAPAARIYAIPYAWTQNWGLHRYGFHGLSHAYCAGRAAEMLGRRDLRLVICHLGHGCSASAVRGNACVETSMGFTPLEGLMMGTRCGSVDPGLLLYLLRNQGLTAERLEHALNHESGLLGVSGVSADLRQVLAAAHAGNARAALALDLYVRRIQQTVGALTVALGGLDALVFTAGVGENAAAVRAAICDGLGFLGLGLDATVNTNCRPDADVSNAAATARTLVVRTREDLVLVRETARVLRG